LIYDADKGDEYTFYFNYVKNRLSTLKRDKYGISVYKMQIADAIPLDGDIEIGIGDIFGSHKGIIDSKIPANIRADYLRFIEGVKIPHRNKLIVIDAIKEIIRVNRLEEDGEQL
jgi:hypothetical protein